MADPFGDNKAGYAGKMMTLRGPADNRQRRRLLPGMRLADGTIWTGDSQIHGMEQQEIKLSEDIVQMQLKLEELRRKLRELKGQAKDVSLVTPQVMTSQEPAGQPEPGEPPVETHEGLTELAEEEATSVVMSSFPETQKDEPIISAPSKPKKTGGSKAQW